MCLFEYTVRTIRDLQGQVCPASCFCSFRAEHGRRHSVRLALPSNGDLVQQVFVFSWKQISMIAERAIEFPGLTPGQSDFSWPSTWG